MRRLGLLLATCLTLSIPALGQAAMFVMGSPGFSYQTVSPGFTINQNGTPHWDNKSMDGSKKNIGYFLTKTGAFSSSLVSPAIPAAQLQFWGDAAGLADSQLLFSSGGWQVTSKFVLTVAGYAGTNQLGYHDTLGDHIVYNPAVDGAVSGQTKTFTPVGSFSFFLWNPSHGLKYYSDTSVAGHIDGSQQHFAVFKKTGTNTLWIGVEDLPGVTYEGRGDFNDLVFSVQAAPEPGTLTVAGIGALALAGYGWRRRRVAAC